MSFDLEEYVPETMGEGDKVKPSDIVDHPLIVKILDFRTGLTTKYNPDGDGEAVVCDVFDMADNKIYLQVMWFNPAIRDNLKNKVGRNTAIRLVFQQSKSGGNSYITPAALEGEDFETAKAWASSKPTLFEDERKDREFGEYKVATPNPTAQAPAFKKEEEKPATSAIKPPSAQRPSANLPDLGGSAPAPAAAAADDDEPPF